jgi:hypothetical protein
MESIAFIIEEQISIWYLDNKQIFRLLHFSTQKRVENVLWIKIYEYFGQKAIIGNIIWFIFELIKLFYIF